MTGIAILAFLGGAALLFFFYKYIKYVAYPVAYALRRRLQFKGLINYVFIFNEIFTEGTYDDVLPETGKASRIFDIGGNIGLYSLYLNGKYKNLDIHTFEPIPALYENLKHNVTVNEDPTNKITVNNFGLSDKEETVTIHYFPKASGLSTIQPDLERKAGLLKSGFGTSKLMDVLLAIFSKTHYVAELVNVKLQRLSNYIDSHNIDRIDIMKIDVEGYELQVLRGIEDRHFPIIRSFMIEIENYRDGYQSDIVAILEKHNYDVSIQKGGDAWSFVVAKQKTA